MEKNIIYHSDCIEGMKILPDNSVDMVLTDPPYGTTQNKWDSVVDMDLFWKEIKRVTKEHSAILIFTQMPFTATAVMSNPKMFRYEWICEKHNPTGFLNAKKQPLRAYETISVFYKKQALLILCIHRCGALTIALHHFCNSKRMSGLARL